MTIPKILLIPRQHSLNYSLAQRPRKNPKTNKQKIGWILQIFYAKHEPLVKACNERENKRELSTHMGEAHVQLSLVRQTPPRLKEELILSLLLWFTYIPIRWRKLMEPQPFLCIQELKYSIWNPPGGTASCGRLGAKHCGVRRRMMMIGAPASSRDLIGSER